MTKEQEASEMQETMQTAGWRHIAAMLDEQISEPKTEFYEKVANMPEQMTDKQGLRLASRAKALEDFKKSILQRLRILRP